MSTRQAALIDVRPPPPSPALRAPVDRVDPRGPRGQLTVVAVMLHVFELTQSTFAVSMIAVAASCRWWLRALRGGMLADAFDPAARSPSWRRW